MYIRVWKICMGSFNVKVVSKPDPLQKKNNGGVWATLHIEVVASMRNDIMKIVVGGVLKMCACILDL